MTDFFFALGGKTVDYEGPGHAADGEVGHVREGYLLLLRSHELAQSTQGDVRRVRQTRGPTAGAIEGTDAGVVFGDTSRRVKEDFVELKKKN